MRRIRANYLDGKKVSTYLFQQLLALAQLGFILDADDAREGVHQMAQNDLLWEAFAKMIRPGAADHIGQTVADELGIEIPKAKPPDPEKLQ